MDKTVNISDSANTFGKSITLIIFPPAISKIVGQTMFFAIFRQPVSEKENSEFEPVKLCLKIDLVLHPVLMEESGKYIKRVSQLLEKKLWLFRSFLWWCNG